jgi:hypothetical protein
MGQRHDGEQAPHVQTGSGGVETDVAGDRFSQKLSTSVGVGALINEAPLLKNVISVLQS